MFLDQLILTLRIEKSSKPHNGDVISGPAGGPSKDSGMGKAAIRHGRELSDDGFTLEQLVHDYGDLCQSIMDLAAELALPIEIKEFRTLNRCLDNAIADAVTEFSEQRRLINDDRVEQALNHRVATLAHELRAHVNAAAFSYAAIKSGQAGLAGATAKVLDRSLKSMRSLIDQTFAEARLANSQPASQEVIAIDELLGDIKSAVRGDAEASNCKFDLYIVGTGLAVLADREVITSVINNLLLNAFKFTHPGSGVSLTAYAEAGKLLIDVQDHCGGLGVVDKEDLFLPFKQSGKTPSPTGVGLGLSIARRGAEANGGTITVRDLPGSGCVFTLSLPLYLVDAASPVDAVKTIKAAEPTDQRNLAS